MVKLTGAQFKAFFDPQTQNGVDPANYYILGSAITVAGASFNADPINGLIDNVPDTAEVNVTGGYLIWQGDGDPSTSTAYVLMLEPELNDWLTANVRSTVTIDVATSDLAALQNYLNACPVQIHVS